MEGNDQVDKSRETVGWDTLFATDSFGPLSFSFQPTMSAQPLHASMRSRSRSLMSWSQSLRADACKAELAEKSKRADEPPDYSSSTAVSLLDILGRNSFDIEQTTNFIWHEALLTEYTTRSLPYADLRVRPAKSTDTLWSNTIPIERGDKITLNDLMFLSYPALSENRAALSFVTSIDGYGKGFGTPNLGRYCTYRHDATSRTKGNSLDLDLAFMTVEIELLPSSLLPDRWKLRWLDALCEERRNQLALDGLALGFNVASMYVHPNFRYRGVGRLQADFIASAIRYLADEVIAQWETIDKEGDSAKQAALCRPHMIKPNLSIAVSGRSPDARGDSVSKHMLKGVFSRFGEDFLSPASSNGGSRLEALRSLARDAALLGVPRPPDELRDIATDFAIRSRSSRERACVARTSAARPLVVAFDELDWSSDRLK